MTYRIWESDDEPGISFDEIISSAEKKIAAYRRDCDAWLQANVADAVRVFIADGRPTLKGSPDGVTLAFVPADPLNEETPYQVRLLDFLEEEVDSLEDSDEFLLAVRADFARAIGIIDSKLTPVPPSASSLARPELPAAASAAS